MKISVGRVGTRSYGISHDPCPLPFSCLWAGCFEVHGKRRGFIESVAGVLAEGQRRMGERGGGISVCGRWGPKSIAWVPCQQHWHFT